MLIYRLEHREERYGPYNCQCPASFTVSRLHYKDPERPVWCEDGLVGKFEPCKKGHRFGFNALEKAFDWFDNALEYLDEFLMVTYECPEEAVILSESGRQVVFEFGKAKSLGEIPFVDAYILGNAPIVKTH